MTDEAQKKSGHVFLVGAGPGDPGLLTLAGQRALSQADVVVFDALADPQLLDHAPAHAERIDAGKRAGEHTLTQHQTNQLLVDHAAAGRTVVRLKGGDPLLFGRGAEEADFLARHGLACTVIPGVTSGIAAPAAAGIPVTHRDVASTVTFVTGHESPDKDDSRVDYAHLAGLARQGGTLCFYMGVRRLPEISSRLIEAGLGPDTPAALVQWGTTPRQRSLRSSLAKLASDVEAAGLASPAIIVIGQAAGLDLPGMRGFESRPLFGQTVVVTRSRQQASELRRLLEEQGARVLEAPTIRIEPPEDWAPVDAALARLQAGRYDWLVITSPNGVHALKARLDHLQLDSRIFARVRLAAIGSATAQALRDQLSLIADLLPDQYHAESLARGILNQTAAPTRLLLLRADLARNTLPDALKAAGCEVEDLTLYRTLPANSLPDEVLAAIQAGEVNWVTFTSSSTVENLAGLLGDDASTILSQLRLASIGPVTTASLKERGLSPAVEAQPSTMESLVQAVSTCQEVT